MRGTLVRFLAAGAIAASALATAPAHATAFADCPYGQVNGSITYNTPVTTIAGPTTWTMTLNATCVGQAPLAGAYTLVFTGQSTESCTSGNGGATVTGTGPNGPLTGSWSFARFGVHYYGFAPYGFGVFTDAAGTHNMFWWLDLYPLSPTGGAAAPCPITHASVIGHGALND
jgi:hypothetical protein